MKPSSKATTIAEAAAARGEAAARREVSAGYAANLARELVDLRAAYSSTVRAHVEAAHARDRYWWQAWCLAWGMIGSAVSWRWYTSDEAHRWDGRRRAPALVELDPCVKNVPTGGSDRAFSGDSVPKGRDGDSGES